MADASENVDVILPSGEKVTTIVPKGWSDAQVHTNLMMQRPDLFQGTYQQTKGGPLLNAGPAVQAAANAPPPTPDTNDPLRALPKATGIGPAPTVMQQLRAGNVPGLDQMQQGMQSVGTQPQASGTSPAAPAFPQQPTVMGKIGQTIGMLTKNPAAQAIAGSLAPVPETTAAGPMKEWQAINESIGATKKSVILPKSATTIEDAVKMPARGLQQEGFDAKTLSKMNPVQQQAAVAPKWNETGRQVFQVIDDATQKGVRLNIQDPINEALGNVYDPQFAKRAQDIVQRVQDTYGISNLKNVSPSEAYIVRKALGESANFSSLGDPKSAAKVSASVYSGITDTLHSQVNGLSGIDQHYADLNSAMDAINNAAKTSSLKMPKTLLQKMKPELLRRGAVGVGAGIGGTIGAGLTYELWKAIWGK